MRFALFQILTSFLYTVHATVSGVSEDGGPYGPLIILEEYNALRSLPDSPNQPGTVQLSFFIRRLQDVVHRAIASIPDMSAEKLIAIGNERPAQEWDLETEAAGLAVSLAVLTEESANNPWNVFRGGEIFRLCAINWHVRSHVGVLAIEALLGLSSTSFEESRLVSKSVGFDAFARDNPQWILLTFSETFDQLAALLDADFDAALATYARPLDWKALEAVRTGAAQIMDASTDEDILVFIGNSASYYYFALMGLGRETYLLPFSGGWQSNQYEEEPTELPHFEEYERVFLDPIRQRAVDSDKTILLIDITISGRTVEIIEKLLRYRRCETCKTQVVQILYPTGSHAAYGYSAPENIFVRALVHPLNHGVYDLLMNGYTRIVPHFSARWWYSSSPAMMALYLSRPAPLTQITKIREHVGSKGLDWPHKHSPMVDVVEYHALRGETLEFPLSLPLYYWTTELASLIPQIPNDIPVGQVQLISRPVVSLAHVADRLDTLRSKTPVRYSREVHHGEPNYTLAEWVFELVDLSRQHEYLRETMMPSLSELATRIPALKEIIRSVFGGEEFSTPSTQF